MRYRFFLFLLMLFTVTDLLPAKEYDLAAILKLAEQNNKDLKLAGSDLEFASAQLKEAISTALPRINVDLGYNRNFLESKFYFTVTDSAGKQRTESFKASFTNEYQLNAVLNQTLFGFGKVGNAIRAANYFKKFTNFQYNGQWQYVITEVKKAFFQVLLLKKVWDVSRQSELSALDNYENIKLKYDSGVVSEFELLQAESRWQNAIPEAMKARKNYELSINYLKALVDIPLREEITLIGDLETYPIVPDSLTYDQIFEQRPDYNALMWEKKLQERRVAYEFSNYLPTLQGNLIYTYGARSDQFRLENKNDNIILGITLNIPVFTGFYTSAQVQKARIDVERVKTRISKANDDIRIEIQNIRLRLQESSERIAANKKSVETARRAFEIAESRVEHGLATQLELKDSRVFLDQAQLNYYSAIYDYLDALFDWQRATGQVTVAGI
ncbi:MAG: TolC family protein [Calditrichia bacterium]